MDAISQDTSSAGMVAAIEANLNETFSLLGGSPSTQLRDDDPDLCWYITPKVPHPLFNHVYFTRLLQEEDVDARIEELRKHFASHQLPPYVVCGSLQSPVCAGLAPGVPRLEMRRRAARYGAGS